MMRQLWHEKISHVLQYALPFRCSWHINATQWKKRAGKLALIVGLLPIILVVQVEQSGVCLCVCVLTITFEVNDL